MIGAISALPAAAASCNTVNMVNRKYMSRFGSGKDNKVEKLYIPESQKYSRDEVEKEVTKLLNFIKENLDKVRFSENYPSFIHYKDKNISFKVVNFISTLDVYIFDGDICVAHIESTSRNNNNKIFLSLLQKLKDEMIPQEQAEAKKEAGSIWCFGR